MTDHENRKNNLQTWLWISGLSSLLIGGIAIAFPLAASITAELLLGAILVVSGGIQIIRAIASGRSSVNRVWSLLFGMTALLAGGVLLLYPLEGLLSLTIVLASFFIVAGVFKVILAWNMRPANLSTRELPGVNGWGWLAFSGALSVVLGALLFWGLPVTAVWALGFLVGIDLIFSGASEIAFARALQRAN